MRTISKMDRACLAVIVAGLVVLAGMLLAGVENQNAWQVLMNLTGALEVVVSLLAGRHLTH